MAEGVHPLPVLIKRFLPLGPGVNKVLDKFMKCNVIPFLQCFRLWVEPMPADDLGSIALVESSVVVTGELVPVGGHQALKGLPHKDELEVVAKALVDLRNCELGERAKVSCHMGFISRDG